MDHHQRGFSLVSVMVGLVISLLAILGMMNLYAVMGKLAAESGGFAQMTGDRAAAVLAATQAMQAAGYGIADAEADAHLRLCANLIPAGNGDLAGNCGTANSGNALLWRTDGTLCEGLYITAAGGLELLSPTSCGSTGFSTTWSSAQRTPLYTPQVPGEEAFASPVAGAVFTTFALVDTPCSPFGVGDPVAGSVRVRLEFHQPLVSPTDPDASYDPSDSSTFRAIDAWACLVNFAEDDE
ncbi:prepilin-type N-terminal cleavage/methylation domain-containing protein [Lamprobacter modestohalophilus]|uniref:PilW family protein n=1 Tax=Lamprobacter modestohalophilus TaxID=1064514 RepID=UPI002ADEBBF8|nr:prepilin-type N-terminal cleavage/methylation domain-containing protein [Lamprobacter modestohalophilus]MEA1052389.1 prepilin-type N-terminal cleavage/methylation domain-containing protein [Lamprobacter modestohalophilus]